MLLTQDHQGVIRLDNEQGIILTGNSNGQIATVNVIDANVQHEVQEITIYTVPIYSLIVENSHIAEQVQVEGEVRLNVILQDTLGRSFPNNLINIDIVAHCYNERVN